jgi:nucleoside phosphorylase
MVCLLVSLKKEIDYFLDLLKDVEKKKVSGRTVYRGRLNGEDIEVVRTGVGKKPIDRSLLESCSALISAGFCGALVPGLKTADVVVSSEVVLADERLLNLIYRSSGPRNGSNAPEPKEITFAAAAGEKLCLLRDKDVRVHCGRTVTATRAIRNYKEKVTLGKASGAVSVDMEDWYRMELAEMTGIPFLCIRSVLDEVHNDLPGFGSGLHFRAHASSLLKNLAPAAASLARALEHFLI